MNPGALHKISYGLYIVTSQKGGRFKGQIANTVFQISNAPPTVAVSINKQNLTHEFIRESKVFVVSVPAQEAPLSLIGQFGFKSGREVDKFAGVGYKLAPGGVPYISGLTLAYLEARVLQEAHNLSQIPGLNHYPAESLSRFFFGAKREKSVLSTLFDRAFS